MAVIIRCRRMGANNDPAFRIVATDKRGPRDGKALEILGWYDPKQTGANFLLKVERVEHWLKNGAMLSDTVRSLLKRARKGDMAAPPVIQAAPVAQT